MLVKVVGKDDEASAQHGGILHNALEGSDDTGGADGTGCDVPIVGVEVVSLVASPDDGSETHGEGNCSDTVVDVSVGWSHRVWRDTSNIFDDFSGPSKLSNDLLVGEGGERWVRPCVNRELVTFGVFRLKDVLTRDRSRSDNEEGRFEVNLVQVLQQSRSVRRWSVIVTHTPCKLLRAASDVALASAPTASPPTDRSVGDEIWVSGATARDRWGYVGNWNARVLNLLDPLLNLWGVGRRCNIQGGIVGNYNTAH